MQGRLEVRKQPVDALLRRSTGISNGSLPADMRGTGSEPTARERRCLEVWADPDRLDQILANLMENAVRHGEGKVSLKVVGTGRDGDEDIAVTVSDEGEGIAPEHYPMIHEVLAQQSPRWYGPGPVCRARTRRRPRWQDQRRPRQRRRGRVPVHLACRRTRARSLTFPRPKASAAPFCLPTTSRRCRSGVWTGQKSRPLDSPCTSPEPLPEQTVTST